MADRLLTHFDSDADNTAQVASTTARRVFFWEFQNPNSSDAYVQLFDLAAADVTVGTTTPKLSILVPANGGNDKFMDKPIGFEQAVTYAATTTVTGNGDPTTGLIVQMGFL